MGKGRLYEIDGWCYLNKHGSKCSQNQQYSELDNVYGLYDSIMGKLISIEDTLSYEYGRERFPRQFRSENGSRTKGI